MICIYFLLAYDLSFQPPSQCSVKTNGDISNFAECNLSFFAFMGCAFTIYYTVNFFLSLDESELFPLPARARYAYPSTQSAGEIFPSGRSRAICLSPGPEMLY